MTTENNKAPISTGAAILIIKSYAFAKAFIVAGVSTTA